jgi:DNA-binding NarL/FixJ family response regulator
MPGMKHLDGLRTMKEKFFSIPVVILTGSVDMNDANTSLEQGAAGYIPKNIGARVMLDALKLILSSENIYRPCWWLKPRSKNPQLLLPVPAQNPIARWEN